MENTKITVGFLPSKLKDVLGCEFKRKQNVYLLSKKQEELSKKYPTSLESKVDEMAHLLYYPDYAIYDKKEKSLFLIRDYQRDGKFQKVVLHLSKKEGWNIADLVPLSYPLLEEINKIGSLTRLN